MVKRKKFRWWLIPLAAILIAVIVGVVWLNSAVSGPKEWKNRYDLGMQYLSELDYTAALLAFTEAIDLEPSIVEGYLGRAEVNIARVRAAFAVNDTDAAADAMDAAMEDISTAWTLQPYNPRVYRTFYRFARAGLRVDNMSEEQQAQFDEVFKQAIKGLFTGEFSD